MKNKSIFLIITFLFSFLFFSFTTLGCSTSSSSSNETATSETEETSNDSTSTSSSTSSEFIQVALYHPGKPSVSSPVLKTYKINEKKAIIAGKTVSASGTGTSVYKKVEVSGKCTYSTWYGYTESFKGGTKTVSPQRSYSGSYTFKKGKKYIINCYTGAVTEN